MAFKIAVLLLMPYCFWLLFYTDAYVESITGKVLGMNLESVLISLNYLVNIPTQWVHEAGHGVCYFFPCPQFLAALNGTIFQLLLPAAFIVYYRREGNAVLQGVSWFWLGQTLTYVAWYMSTAQTPNKYPSLIPYANVHDFWFIFSQMGLLEYNGLFAGSVRFIAIVILLGSYGYLLHLAFFKNNAKEKALPDRRGKEN